jgi:chromosome segregation ATPase
VLSATDPLARQVRTRLRGVLEEESSARDASTSARKEAQEAKVTLENLRRDLEEVHVTVDRERRALSEFRDKRSGVEAEVGTASHSRPSYCV